MICHFGGPEQTSHQRRLEFLLILISTLTIASIMLASLALRSAVAGCRNYQCKNFAKCYQAITKFTRPFATMQDKQATMPPGYKAKAGAFQTFEIPQQVTGSRGDIILGKAMINAWRRDGILQVSMDESQRSVADKAFATSQRYFDIPYDRKASCVNDQSFSGYIASGEELTDNIADYSEIFTVTKDLPQSDPRVKAKWPCHGPCPWPDTRMKSSIKTYMNHLGDSGDKILQLIACGLELPDINELTKYTRDGWHHLRVLRFPARDKTNGKGKDGRGIGSHTDYGLLVIASQDSVGGLFIRPPYKDEKYANWEKSVAGAYENDHRWVYVPPVPNVFTVFPGDMMQYITNSYLPSTPHKVGLNNDQRFAFAYFHEPNFQATLEALPGFESDENSRGIHYGTHFTNMSMRNYPQRITAKRIRAENRMAVLHTPELKTLGAAPKPAPKEEQGAEGGMQRIVDAVKNKAEEVFFSNQVAV
ncbi:Clavaminate synthase-like protein [Eremomyces bilateralis CBS 781.70]|uniref:Clavaminate synthase-like protein n=1 Tax=Eremomyces bilateralis CBS 781.70 TaxID=1392243 RepID=A0A6G1GG84_9PEZI|nr:Clavaminate synthase-like protein [Eremomyces bilateralis CBS 781.70]KAF1817024.1 Clavaminate synthase-like protein [Eremomyces bilateralis CBS 781.70]